MFPESYIIAVQILTPFASLEAKESLLDHVSQSARGAVSIRANGWAHMQRARFASFLQATQSPYCGLLYVQNWLTFSLLLVVTIFLTLLTGAGLLGREKTRDPAFLGVALVTVMNMSTNLTHLMNHWASLEVTLGGVARVKEFSEETPSEEMSVNGAQQSAPLADATSADWPHKGILSIRNWSAYHTCSTEYVSHNYPPSLALTVAVYPLRNTTKFGDLIDHVFSLQPLVLRNICLEIDAGQKVAICGRTGRYVFRHNILKDPICLSTYA